MKDSFTDLTVIYEKRKKKTSIRTFQFFIYFIIFNNYKQCLEWINKRVIIIFEIMSVFCFLFIYSFFIYINMFGDMLKIIINIFI